MGTSTHMIERSYGALLDGAGAGIASRLDAFDANQARAAENSAGFQSPAPDHVLVFEEGGVLTVLRLSVNDNVVIDRAATGQARNAVDEVTCSFTFTAAPFFEFEVTGVLNAH